MVRESWPNRLLPVDEFPDPIPLTSWICSTYNRTVVKNPTSPLISPNKSKALSPQAHPVRRGARAMNERGSDHAPVRHRFGELTMCLSCTLTQISVVTPARDVWHVTGSGLSGTPETLR